MKKSHFPAGSRGYADHGWLKSYHSFSFASYYNPERIHFGMLRVLNDDSVEGGMGFGSHPHDNMEIVSIPLEGELEHKDSTGTKQKLLPGEVQIMSAGTGIVHSEYNALPNKPVKFLQIWIFPKKRNIVPRYEQKLFPAEGMENRLQLLVSPDKEEGTLWINQDAKLYLGRFKEEKEIQFGLKEGHGAYIFIIEGEAQAADEKLSKRDAIGIWETGQFSIKAGKDSYILLMDLPME